MFSLRGNEAENIWGFFRLIAILSVAYAACAAVLAVLLVAWLMGFV